MIFQAFEKAGIGFESGSGRFDPELPTLLMVHGAGGSAQVWRNQVYPLKSSFNTLAIDLPGHGKTAGPHGSTIDEYANWLMEAILGVFPQPPYVVGHSMGGAIVQELAFQDPRLMKGIVLAGTGPMLKVAPTFLEGMLKDFEKTIDMVMAYAYAPDADRRLITEGAALMKASGSAQVHGDFSACDRFDMRDRVSRITLKTLVLCGEKDLLTPPSLCEKLKTAIRNSCFHIIPAAGHMVMIEQYKAFNKSVLDFIHGVEC